MTTYSAGEASLSIVPDARQFRDKLEADLRKIQVEKSVQITAELGRAREQLDKFRAEEEARAIHKRVKVSVDHQDMNSQVRDAVRTVFDEFRNLDRNLDNVGAKLAQSLKINLAAVGVELLPSLATGLVEVSQAMEQLADAGLALPGVLAAVGASIGTLALGVDGVKEAWGDVSKVADLSASQQARAAQQVTSATDSLRDAITEEAKAQKDVADARRDARQQLEDLNLELRGGALSEKEAILEAAKARRDLATGRFKDSLDYQGAALRVEEADQRVTEARQHNIELQDKVSRENAKGIEGSDRVVAANERLTRSQQSVQKASEALANVGAGAPADKAAEALAKLAPNAREFVQAMVDLKPAFKDLQTGVQQNLFAGMGASLKALAQSDIPNFKSGLGSIASALNQDFKQLFASLGSDSSKGLIDRILGNTANANTRVKAAIDPIVHAFGTLTAAGTDTMPRLADAITHVSDRFNTFIGAAAEDGRLSKWINDGETAFTHLGDILLQIGQTVHGIDEALGGKGLLASLDGATKKLAEFVNSAAGQQKLTKLFQDGRDEFNKWKPVIEDIARMVPTVFAAMKEQADLFLPVIHEITSTLAENPALLKQIVDGYLLWHTTIDPIRAVGKTLLEVRDSISIIKTAIGGVGDAMKLSTAVMQAEAAKQVEAQEKIAAAAVEADAAAGGTGAATRLGKLGAALGAAAGPVGLLAAGGLLLYDTADAQDEGGKKFQRDMAAAKTPEEREEIQKRYFGNKYVPPQPTSPTAPVPAGTPKQLIGPDGHSNIGQTGSLLDQAEWEALAAKGDPGAQWVLFAKDPADMAKRGAWLIAHQDQDKDGFRPPTNYAAGGILPGSATIQPATPGLVQWAEPSTGGEAFIPLKGGQRSLDIWRQTGHLIGAFDDGGIRIDGDPRNAAPNPATLGPASVAPNPTGGYGIFDQVLGAAASGISGPIGNAISFGTALSHSGGMAGGGGANIPGIWGLAGAAGNPNAMQAWGSQTTNWLANFAGKTLLSGGTTLLQGALGAVGLGGSILSPSNPYNQAIQKTAGFYLGDQSPFRAMMGGSADLSGAGIGSQTIAVGPGGSESIQTPTFGTAQGAPAGMTNSDGSLTPAAQRAIQYAQAHAVGQKYVYGGLGPTGYDCSGIASAIYAAAKGLPEGQRYFTTESDFGALGFLPGYQKGDLNIGVMRGGGGPNSHMVLTLPNGINVESGGASDTTQIGGTAKGALDLPLHWHLSLSGNQGVGSVPGLYDEGGPWPTGTLGINNSGKTETVLTNEQATQQHQAMQTVAQHLASQPSPVSPQSPDAGHLQTPQATPQGPQQPPSVAAQPVPSPTSAAPDVPTPTPTGGAVPPGGHPAAVAPAPSNLDHNLKAIDTGIDSAAQAIGQAASTAIGVAGAGAGMFGGGAAGAIGPYVAGLINEGGKVAKDAVNIGSSFLVGNVTGGTQDSAYGAPLRPGQNNPNVAAAPNVTNWNISGNYELRAAQEQAELMQAQQQQVYWATHGRISP